MNITSVGKIENGDIRVELANGRILFVPDNTANRDRRWLKREYEDKGGVIAPAPPPEPEPTQAELDAEQTAKIEKQGTILYALGKRIFKIERRLAALEGTDPITVAKFREEIEADLY